MATMGKRRRKKEEARQPKREADSIVVEGGFAMVFVLFAIMVVGILGALVLLYTTYALQNAVGVTPAGKAQAAAEVGMDMAHALLSSEAITSDYDSGVVTIWDDKGTYDVLVEKNPQLGDGDPNDWRITSIGTYTANVEGVERNFYRTLEEVVSFAGGRYYSALDFVLFSKEGNVDVSLSGNLELFNVQGVTIEGNIYAGRNVNLASGAKLASGFEYQLNGNVVTETGDISVRQGNALFASSSFRISGNLYSGNLTPPTGVGGGIRLETSTGLFGGGTITLTTSDPAVGCINSHGRLSDNAVPYGVYLRNFTGFAGSNTTTINGNIHSDRDVRIENGVILGATSAINVQGMVHSAGNVNVKEEMFLAASMKNTISGGIYAAGNVDLYGSAFLLGTLSNKVGGDIHAGGDVNIYHQFSIGCGSGSGYQVGGNIYGRNVIMNSRLGAVGTIDNKVGGNIVCRGGSLDIDNSATLGTSTVNIGGNIYTTGGVNIYTKASLANARLTVSGGTTVLNPPGQGCYSNGSMELHADNSASRITITGNAKQSSGTPTIPHSANVTISGTTTPAVGSFNVPAAVEPEDAVDYPEVQLPQCDFDYYRELAKGQEVIDGKQHYYPASVPDLDIAAAEITSSIYVIFVDGDLGIGTVEVPINRRGVFVATGNITIRETLRRSGSGGASDFAEFQIIAKNKVRYDTDANVEMDLKDKFFIYSAHDTYDPVSDPISVEYEMGWFRGIEGQITARGDIIIKSNVDRYSRDEHNYSIRYKNPTVLGEAFRIPFVVKSWKEL